jgi:hypothetical protein
VGSGVGLADGKTVGEKLGDTVGSRVGETVGDSDIVGIPVGANVGFLDGVNVVGALVGWGGGLVGWRVGLAARTDFKTDKQIAAVNTITLTYKNNILTNGEGD